MVFKHVGRKLRYAKRINQNRAVPVWVIIRKFGRVVSLWRLGVRRDWRRTKISL